MQPLDNSGDFPDITGDVPEISGDLAVLLFATFTAGDGPAANENDGCCVMGGVICIVIGIGIGIGIAFLVA
jgi:hypothetical protein